MTIEVIESFKTNDRSRLDLRVGLRGIIRQIDGEGDINIKFEGIEKRKWVFAKNGKNLRAVDVDDCKQSEKPRTPSYASIAKKSIDG